MFGGGMMFADSQGNVAGMAGAGAKQERKEEKMTVLPVTCNVIANAVSKAGGDDSDIQFFGTEAGMLLLVGQVESVSQTASSHEFTLNDSTGRFQARYYVQGSDAGHEAVEAGRYVAVAGQVRTTPAVHLSVTTLRLIKSVDEISYHMIEVAHAALKFR